MNAKTKPLLAKFVILSSSLFFGCYFYAQTFSSYQIASYTATGIVAGKYPYHDYEMSVNYFIMDIDTQKQITYLSFDIIYFDKGNHSLLLTLPYRIVSFENLGTGTWDVRNAASGSVVMATLNVENISETGYGHQTFRAALHTQDSIIDRVFETNSINLPFGGSITQDIQEKLDELQEIVPIGIFGDGFNGTVKISIPHGVVITGTTLQVERRDPTKDYQVLEFQISQFKQFQLQYVDITQRRNFERNLLFTGVLFGVFGSALYDVAIEVILNGKKFMRKKSHNITRKTNRNNAEQSDQERS